MYECRAREGIQPALQVEMASGAGVTAVMEQRHGSR
jgi:hypothetical protein